MNSPQLGLVFGLCVGMVFVARTYARAGSVVLVLLAAMTVLSVTYLPWPEGWRSRHEVLEIVEVGEKAKAGDPEAQHWYGAFLTNYEENKAEGSCYAEHVY